MSGTLVTVTGASGFIGLYCVRELLEQGYRVRALVRSSNKQEPVRQALAELGASPRLSFAEADLLHDTGWAEAMVGARYVVHVASPLPPAPPKHENDLIIPAREGTRRVLEAASQAGVSRVVLMSSLSAVMSGHQRSPDRTFDERDWSDLSQPLAAYEKSKTLAERAAWQLVEALPAERRLEMVSLNPALVLGPSLNGTRNTSNEAVIKLLKREVPGVPNLQLGMVDVRDVAKAVTLALQTPEAASERIILMSDVAWFTEVAEVLKQAGYKVPTRRLPTFLVRLVALVDPAVRLIVDYLDQPFIATSAKAQRLLGWQGRAMKEMVLDTARSYSTER